MAPKKKKDVGSFLDSMLEEDSPDTAVALPGSAGLSDLQERYNEYMRLSGEIASKEEELAELKGKLRRLSEQELPDLMFSVGLKSFVASDGTQVITQEDVAVSITEANYSKAMAWLRKVGLGDIIKQEFKIPFDKGKDKEAALLRKTLEAKGWEFTEKQGVHASTLKSTIRSYIEDGKTVPDVISVYQFRVTKFKKGKK